MSDYSKYPSQVKPEIITQEEAIERLKHAFAYDFMDVDEFEKRLEKVTGTKNTLELHSLVHDLPVIIKKETPMPSTSNAPVKESDSIIAMMSGISRKGKWRPPRNLKVVSFMAGVDLDFTKVDLPAGVTEVTIVSVMSGVEIIVPPGINVDASGFAFMGGFDDYSHNDVAYPGAPTLKIRGFTLMGGIDIRPPKQKLLGKILKKFHLE